MNVHGGLQKEGVIKIHTVFIEANQDIFLACLCSFRDFLLPTTKYNKMITIC